MKFRDAYPFGARKHWPYKVLCQEVRDALGFEVKKPARKSKRRVRLASEIMPSMREWAIKHGIAVEQEA